MIIEAQVVRVSIIYMLDVYKIFFHIVYTVVLLLLFVKECKIDMCRMHTCFNRVNTRSDLYIHFFSHFKLQDYSKLANLVHGFNLSLKVFGGHTELLHGDISRSRESEAVNSNNLGGILVPKSGNTGLDGNTLGA